MKTLNTITSMAQFLDLETDTKYAICLLKLNSAVVPGDYPNLKSAIEGVTGVQEITLIIDHQTRATIPANTQLKAVGELN